MREELEPVAQERSWRRPSVELHIEFGTMIELPRACLDAGEIAEHADFFSFGTNDLSQTAFGFSRDDIGKFLAHVRGAEARAEQPVRHDRRARRRAIDADRGRRGPRSRTATCSLGICGEHGGDPDSVWFCEKLGLDYVSCSPFRVPTARLAAAQAVLGEATPAPSNGVELAARRLGREVVRQLRVDLRGVARCRPRHLEPRSESEVASREAAPRELQTLPAALTSEGRSGLVREHDEALRDPSVLVGIAFRVDLERPLDPLPALSGDLVAGREVVRPAAIRDQCAASGRRSCTSRARHRRCD